MKISEFGAISGIPRKTLIFYDKIDLLSPQKTDDNSYRYYSFNQIDTASVVKTLCEIGTPLKEIKNYLDNRSPDSFINLMEDRKYDIEQQIIQLERLRELIDTRIDLTRKGLKVDTSQIQHVYCPQENLFLGSELPDSKTIEEAWRYLSTFYEACKNQKIEFGRPIGCIIPKEFLTIKGYHCLSNYYYKLSNNDNRTNCIKPAGLYVIAYEYTAYGRTDGLYDRINKYINDNDLYICGDIYTEYILDEIITSDSNNYLAQVSIPVKTRDNR